MDPPFAGRKTNRSACVCVRPLPRALSINFLFTSRWHGSCIDYVSEKEGGNPFQLKSIELQSRKKGDRSRAHRYSAG